MIWLKVAPTVKSPFRRTTSPSTFEGATPQRAGTTEKLAASTTGKLYVVAINLSITRYRAKSANFGQGSILLST